MQPPSPTTTTETLISAFIATHSDVRGTWTAVLEEYGREYGRSLTNVNHPLRRKALSEIILLSTSDSTHFLAQLFATEKIGLPMVHHEILSALSPATLPEGFAPHLLRYHQSFNERRSWGEDKNYKDYNSNLPDWMQVPPWQLLLTSYSHLNPSDASILIQYLSVHDDEADRLPAIMALGKISSPTGHAQLFTLLKKHIAWFDTHVSLVLDGLRFLPEDIAKPKILARQLLTPKKPISEYVANHLPDTTLGVFVVCGSIVPDPLQELEPVTSPAGPGTLRSDENLKNKKMLRLISSFT